MIHSPRPTGPRLRRFGFACAASALVAGCTGDTLDVDLRDLGNGFDTSDAVASPPERPRPDARGVISYPTYQVAVAQRDDTVTTVATRLGINPNELARFNGLSPDTPLRRDEVVALPGRVSDPAAAPGGVDVAAVAGAAIDRAGPVTTTPLGPSTTSPAPAAAPQPGPEPIRHQVARGETVYSVARLYNVSARGIADWNGLGPDLSVREGQFLMIPTGGQAPPARVAPTVAPGTGSPTPVPPSASTPLPPPDPVAAPAAPDAAPEPTPAPDLGSQQSAPASDAPMIRPVSGSIIRAYAPGRNEGVDFAAAAGAEVRAAAAGTVAAVTTDTAGIRIVVIRHSDGLLTVYTHVEDLTVERGTSVSQGQVIGTVRAGDPSFLHFEVRRGTESADPTEFLP